MRDVLAAVRTGARGFAWFIRGVLGEDAYDKYAAHHAAAHGAPGSCRGGEAGDCGGGSSEAGDCGGSSGEAGDCGGSSRAMTEREFWRDQTDRQQRNPQGRCC